MNTIVHLEIDEELWPAVTVALQRGIDDLSLRVMLSERHGDELGRRSAAEYLADIERLRRVLDELGISRRPDADPPPPVVRWIDGHVYTVDAANGLVRLAPATPRPTPTRPPKRDHVRPDQPRSAPALDDLRRWSR